MSPPRRSLPWSSLAITAVGLFSTGPMGTLAQVTAEVTCLPSFGSLNNSLNQNPCLLSAYLQGACNGGEFNVSALPVDTHYTGPFADQDNPCQCSTVTYNALSACGLCQDRTIISWPTWNTNCTTIYPGVFLPGVPDGTVIPHWAFQDVTATNLFNVTLAAFVGDLPEATPTHVQSTIFSLSPTSTDDPASLTAAPTSTSGSKSNAGAIAGGVVGGIAGAVLIAAAIIFSIRTRKRSQMPPSAEFTAVSSAAFTDTTPFAPQMPQPRLYDPSDPSTFPASPPPTTIRTGSSFAVPSSPYSTTPPGVRYSGMPEV